MNATTEEQSDALPPAVQALSEKQQRIYKHLAEHAESKTYFKSRLIGNALNLSSKEVGSNMHVVVESDTPLSIEKWGCSAATTWAVTRSTSN